MATTMLVRNIFIIERSICFGSAARIDVLVSVYDLKWSANIDLANQTNANISLPVAHCYIAANPYA